MPRELALQLNGPIRLTVLRRARRAVLIAAIALRRVRAGAGHRRQGSDSRLSRYARLCLRQRLRVLRAARPDDPASDDVGRGGASEPRRAHQRRRGGPALHGRLARDRRRAELPRPPALAAVAPDGRAGIRRRRAVGAGARVDAGGQARQRDHLDAAAELRRAADRQLSSSSARGGAPTAAPTRNRRLSWRPRGCRALPARAFISACFSALSASRFTAWR